MTAAPVTSLRANYLPLLLTTETASDRLTITLFLALLLHLLLLTVSFSFREPGNSLENRLDIVLVQTRSAQAPEEARFIAQANQDGGGDSQEEIRATTPTRAEFPAPAPAVTSTRLPPQLAAAAQVAQDEQLSQQASTDKIQYQSHQRPVEQPQDTAGEAEQTVPEVDELSHADLILNARNIVASIQADLDDSYRAFKDRPPHKYISARTRESKYATYMDAWRIRVERLGAQHFPDEARIKRLSGSLVMDLALNANGTIHDIEIVQSSDHGLLDDTALRIARMGAPYMPFSAEILKEMGDSGILHIIRTWHFDSDGRFSSR